MYAVFAAKAQVMEETAAVMVSFVVLHNGSKHIQKHSLVLTNDLQYHFIFIILNIIFKNLALFTI